MPLPMSSRRETRATSRSTRSPPLLQPDPQRPLDVALVGELRDGAQPARAPGMAGDERELVLDRADRAPLEPVLGMHGLAGFVDAEEGEVQVVARERETVGIAA